MVPDMSRYKVSTVKFCHMAVETLNWNYVDFCVVYKGRGSEFNLEYVSRSGVVVNSNCYVSSL